MALTTRQKKILQKQLVAELNDIDVDRIVDYTSPKDFDTDEELYQAAVYLDKLIKNARKTIINAR